MMKAVDVDLTHLEPEILERLKSVGRSLDLWKNGNGRGDGI